jgi:hypothetical protein
MIENHSGEVVQIDRNSCAIWSRVVTILKGQTNSFTEALCQSVKSNRARWLEMCCLCADATGGNIFYEAMI